MFNTQSTSTVVSGLMLFRCSAPHRNTPGAPGTRNLYISKCIPWGERTARVTVVYRRATRAAMYRLPSLDAPVSDARHLLWMKKVPT